MQALSSGWPNGNFSSCGETIFLETTTTMEPGRLSQTFNWIRKEAMLKLSSVCRIVPSPDCAGGNVLKSSKFSITRDQKGCFGKVSSTTYFGTLALARSPPNLFGSSGEKKSSQNSCCQQSMTMAWRAEFGVASYTNDRLFQHRT